MLGSTRMVTNASGATVECYDYLPFGRMLSDGVNARNTGCYPPNPDYQISSRLPQKFTGKERDAETRLDYFGARYFSAAHGRFISADWSAKPTPVPYANFANPQSLNLYSYVHNNPLVTADPDGHCGNNDICDALVGAAKGTGNFVKDLATSAGQIFWLGISGQDAALWEMYTTPVKVAVEDYTKKGFSGVANEVLDHGAVGAMEIVTEAVLTGGLAATSQATSLTPRTTMYRAVGPNEARSIGATGEFQPSPNGTMYKGFFNELGDAQNFAARLQELTGKQHEVHSGNIPNSIIRKSPDHRAATEGFGKNFLNEYLNKIKGIRKVE